MLFPYKTTYYLLQCLKQNLIILPLSLFYNGTVTFLGFHPSGIFPSSRNTLYTLVCHSATASPCLSFSCSTSTTGVLPFFNLLITFLTPSTFTSTNIFKFSSTSKMPLSYPPQSKTLQDAYSTVWQNAPQKSEIWKIMVQRLWNFPRCGSFRVNPFYPTLNPLTSIGHLNNGSKTT